MKYKIKENSELRKYCNSLDVKELLKLVICPNLVVNKEYDLSLYKGIPSIFIHPNELDKIQKLIKEINDINGTFKTLFVTDMEAGPGTALVGATAFNSLRGAAQTKSTDLCYKMGLSASIEGRQAGFDWTFGPVVDILGNPNSPIMSLRSAGEDASDVNKYAYAYYLGIEDGGMISTIKHFPGDGYCMYDQHLTTPENPLTKKQWNSTFGEVFKKFIDSGVKSIMPGHISLPCYDDVDEETKSYLPSTMSYNILTKLLKNKLGFKGLIISDAVNMGGFSGYTNIYKGCARFLNAGGDALLFMHPTNEYFENMINLIKSNELDIEVLKDRAYRNLAFALQNSNKKEYKYVESQKISFEITKQSAQIYKDKNKILPLKVNKKILHVNITTQIEDKIIKEFNNQLLNYCDVTYIKDPGCDKLVEIAKSGLYDYIICSVGNKHAYGTNQIFLSGYMSRNMMGGWTKFATPVVFVDFFHPYIHLEYQTVIDTLIYTYGYTSDTPKVVCELLFNE